MLQSVRQKQFVLSSKYCCFLFSCVIIPTTQLQVTNDSSNVGRHIVSHSETVVVGFVVLSSCAPQSII